MKPGFKKSMRSISHDTTFICPLTGELAGSDVKRKKYSHHRKTISFERCLDKFTQTEFMKSKY